MIVVGIAMAKIESSIARLLPHVSAMCPNSRAPMGRTTKAAANTPQSSQREFGSVDVSAGGRGAHVHAWSRQLGKRPLPPPHTPLSLTCQGLGSGVVGREEGLLEGGGELGVDLRKRMSGGGGS